MDYANNILLDKSLLQRLRDTGYEGPLNLTGALNHLLDMLEQQEKPEMKASNIIADAADYGQTAVAARIAERSFALSTAKDEKGVFITYDMSNFKNRLPEDMDLMNVRIEAQDGEKNRRTMALTKGTFAVNAYPVNITSEAYVRTPEGMVTLRSASVVDKDRDGKAVLTVREEPRSTSTKTVAEFLEANSSVTANLKQRLTDLEEGNYLAEIVALKQKVKSLESKVNEG